MPIASKSWPKRKTKSLRYSRVIQKRSSTESEPPLMQTTARPSRNVSMRLEAVPTSGQSEQERFLVTCSVQPQVALRCSSSAQPRCSKIPLGSIQIFRQASVKSLLKGQMLANPSHVSSSYKTHPLRHPSRTPRLPTRPLQAEPLVPLTM